MNTLANMYRDFVNEYLTLGKFAEDHELDIDDAETILRLGKKYHERGVEIYKKK